MTYIIDKGVSFDSAALEWKTEPPTKPGTYWVYIPHDKSLYGPNLVEIELDRDKLGVWNGGDFEEVKYYGWPLKTYWLGPLPIPEPPKQS